VALAETLGAAVSLIHVIEPPSWLSGVALVMLVRGDSEVIALARKKLATLAKREAKGDVAVTSYVRTGKPFHEITTAARGNGADLIVIATHGYTGVERVLLGSTAEQVVRHAACPVLTVPAGATRKGTGKPPPFKIKKILVPIDFSNLSKDASPWATFLAAKLGAEIILLHAVEKFPIDYLLGRELMSHTIVPLMKQAEADLERIAVNLSKSTKVSVSAVVRDGTPFEEICHAAKLLGADLIALTTHGYTGLKHIWLGSTAERVVRHAHCPVLVVRELTRHTEIRSNASPPTSNGEKDQG
jgi:nucleotide-binding universal stress UspA family protein